MKREIKFRGKSTDTGKWKPKSTMEQLVDKACGYNEVEEVKKEAITLLEQIVESKKAIGVNYSGDSKFLDKLKNKETHE